MTFSYSSMFSTILIVLLSTNHVFSWSGILLDGLAGKTQLYVPGNTPTNTPNIDFGLPHLQGQTVVMLNEKVYFTGGYPLTNDVTIFDPTTNKSTPGTPLNVARFWHAAIVVNDTIIVCGGQDKYGTALSSCEQYNQTTQKWNMFTPLPVPTKGFVMMILNNRVYAFGGSGECSDVPKVYMFDGQNWVSRTSTLGVSYMFHAGIALDTDRALLCGGMAYKDGTCSLTGDCVIYTTSSDSWKRAPSMTRVRNGHSMVSFMGEDLYCY
jgi:N-acetylneuraminic acid mutarotase